MEDSIEVSRKIYRQLLVDQNSERTIMVGRCFSAAFDYGVFCVKNLFIVNGAGLLALPGLAGFAQIQESVIIGAAVCFVFGLMASLFAAYGIHINYLNNLSSLINKKYATDTEIYEIDTGELNCLLDQRRIYEAAEKFHDKIVKITFYGPHLFGLLSSILFILGCLLALYSIEVK